MKKNNWSKMIIILSVILVGFSLIVLIPFFWNFGSKNLESTFSKWVEFSTYIYNFFILILTLINIILIAYIAKIAQSFDSEKFQKNIELQQQYNKESRLYECKTKISILIEDIQKSMNEDNYQSFIISQASLTDFLKLFSKTIELDEVSFKEFDEVLDTIGDELQKKHKDGTVETINNNLFNSFVEKKYKFISSLN